MPSSSFNIMEINSISVLSCAMKRDMTVTNQRRVSPSDKNSWFRDFRDNTQWRLFCSKYFGQGVRRCIFLLILLFSWRSQISAERITIAYRWMFRRIYQMVDSIFNQHFNEYCTVAVTSTTPKELKSYINDMTCCHRSSSSWFQEWPVT